MSVRSFRDLIQILSGRRNRRGIVPTPAVQTKSSSEPNNMFNIIYKNPDSYEKVAGKSVKADTFVLDVNELKTMLPTAETENEMKTCDRNHKINGEVCLLKESPFRILRDRVSTMKAKSRERDVTIGSGDV